MDVNEDIEVAKQKRIAELQDLHKDYVRIFQKRGSAKRVLEHLYEVGFMWDITLIQDESNADTGMAFREGRRSMALHIRYMLERENFTNEALTKKIAEEHYHAMD